MYYIFIDNGRSVECINSILSNHKLLILYKSNNNINFTRIKLKKKSPKVIKYTVYIFMYIRYKYVYNFIKNNKFAKISISRI